MSIRSTFFQYTRRHRYTWRHPSGNSMSHNDHILIDRRYLTDLIDVKTYRGANIDSDHFLIMVKLRHKLSVVNNQRSQPRLHLGRLKCVDLAEGYAIALGEALPTGYNIDAMPLGSEQAISTTSEHKIGRLPRRVKKEWFDEECRRALSEKNAARARMLRCYTVL